MSALTEKDKAIHLDNVVFSYDTKKNDQARTFHCPQWSLDFGKHVFLHGESGSGKSTFLNLLSGILTPQSGAVNLLGEDVTKLSASKRDRFRAQNLGIVFQQFNLIPYLSVSENIALAAYFAKQKDEIKDSVLQMMSFLNLSSDLLEQTVSALSMGQKQRVAIIRAFINRPKILLIDEPTSSLDSAARDGFMEMLITLTNQHQCTLIFVSHDQALKSHFDYQTPLTDIGFWTSTGEQGNA